MQLETVGEIIRILRARRGLEQVELARACGWRDASAVSRIETDRIRPTRRTLGRLADALAHPEITGAPHEVRAWLFLASGQLPSKDEIARLSQQLPSIAERPQPTMIRDFGWNVWRANEQMVSLIGLPGDYAGRNLIEMLLTETSIRERLGEAWRDTLVTSVRQFRAETARRTQQRWYRKLMASLELNPDLRDVWSEAGDGERDPVYGVMRTTVNGSAVDIVRLRLTVDPRLTVVTVLPTNVEAARSMEKEGSLLR